MKTTFGQLAQQVKEFLQIQQFELNRVYQIGDMGLSTDDECGNPVRVDGFIMKYQSGLQFTFSDGSIVECAVDHLFSNCGHIQYARDLCIDDTVVLNNGQLLSITGIVELPPSECYDLCVDSQSHLYSVANRTVHHNTFNVERILTACGKTEDKDYARVAGSVTAPNIYKKLYDFRDGIVLFDDCDSALGDQESRNIIKGATDTKKVRAISWEKNASFVYNPNKIPQGPAMEAWINKQDKKSRIPDWATNPERFDEFYLQCKQEEGLYPNKFNFSGKVIFISNLQLDELDPDKSIRTRAFVISINPSDEDVLKFMVKIADKLPISGGNTLSVEDRMDVIEILKKSPKSLNMRVLQRGFNLRAAGFKNWEYLLSNYG